MFFKKQNPTNRDDIFRVFESFNHNLLEKTSYEVIMNIYRKRDGKINLYDLVCKFSEGELMFKDFKDCVTDAYMFDLVAGVIQSYLYETQDYYLNDAKFNPHDVDYLNRLYAGVHHNLFEIFRRLPSEKIASVINGMKSVDKFELPVLLTNLFNSFGIRMSNDEILVKFSNVTLRLYSIKVRKAYEKNYLGK